MMWHVPNSMYTGHTSRLVEMLDLCMWHRTLFHSHTRHRLRLLVADDKHGVLLADPTLVELAGLPPVPKCNGDPEPSVHCLMGTSYASAFGVGTEQPRSAVVHQWPYSTVRPQPALMARL